jgi:hypothetical protein
MINATATYRSAARGMNISGMHVDYRNGGAWSGEFFTTIGKGDLGRWLAGSDRSALAWITLTQRDSDMLVFVSPNELLNLDFS